MSQAGLARLTSGGMPPSVVITITGNDGIPESAVANNFNIITANSTPEFLGTSGTETLDFGLSNLALGSSLPALTSGTNNVFYGLDAGDSVTVGSLNVGIGVQALQNAIEASDNVAIGFNSMNSATAINANSNVAVGSLSLSSLVDGNDTVAVGYQALTNIVSGGSNTAVGYRAGFNYTTTETFNITIGNAVGGTVGESNTTRIGSSQARCFIDGIQGVSVTNPLFVVINSATDQLGTVSSGSVGQTITGNTGGPIAPVAGNWNLVTEDATVLFVGSGSTLKLDFGDSTTFNLGLGSSYPALTTGTVNVSLGAIALSKITSGSSNVAIGVNALANNATTSSNVSIGVDSLKALVGGGNNVAIGRQAFASATSVGSSVAVGEASLQALLTGDNNTAVGTAAGANYTGAESNNILIGNRGVLGESNVMRLGIQGSGSAQQTQTHIAGVINTVSGRVVKTTIPGAYPYTTLTTDYVILVDTSAARTINLIAAPVTGTTYRIKDNVGTGAAFNITVTPAAGTIDGAASFVMNANWESIDVVYNGTSWRIL